MGRISSRRVWMRGGSEGLKEDGMFPNVNMESFGSPTAERLNAVI